MHEDKSVRTLMPDVPAVEEIPENTANIPDFNLLPLNGEAPADILSKFGVHAKVVGPRDRLIGAYPIKVTGKFASVGKFIEHLQATWPPEPVL